MARPQTRPAEPRLSTGIDKRPVNGPVSVRSPGSMQSGLGSGLQGDLIGNHEFHGGDARAVYAYAREDLDVWQVMLERDPCNGVFGENLTWAPTG